MFAHRPKNPFPNSRKPELAIDKHLRALAGTAFADKCAFCPGSAGKINSDGNMMCSNAGAAPSPVTPALAARCDGKKPITSDETDSVRISAIFLKQGGQMQHAA